MGTTTRRLEPRALRQPGESPDADHDGLLAAERAARIRAQESAERLQHANRAKDEFLSELAHELRTPLTAILGWASLLRQRQFDQAVLARGLETIELSARAQAELIDDLSDLSRVVSGKLRLEIRPVDLRLAVQTALEGARPSAEAKGIRLEAAIPGVPCPVRGDRNRLQQVMGNLLTNAVKFTPEGGTVSVSLERGDDQIRLEVADTGIGIAADLLPYVFDRFRQADDASTRAHGGLGLGLSIVRHLVELHGGSVSAHSDGDGLGARFSVALPATGSAARRGDEALDPAAASHAPLLEGVKLLLVEDDAPSRQAIAALLEQEGAEVVATASVAEALGALEGRRPDVVVSDIRMPGSDGYELIKKLRAAASEASRAIPAVALTGLGGADRERALNEGFQLHVAKPIDGRELASAVASLVRPAVPVDGRSIEEQLDTELASLAGSADVSAVISAQVQHLSRIRARHGTAGVNAVITGFVDAARGVLRGSDRIVVTVDGGLVIFCRGADGDAGAEIVERLRNAAAGMETPLDDGRVVRAAVSLGVASSSDSTVPRAALLEASRQALEAARQRGEDVVHERVNAASATPHAG
ncbi:MAG: ATP-binding protein [Candidatus Limnocylindria bacterium]